MGTCRDQVKPNMKERRRGLRVRPARCWLAKYLHQVHGVAKSVENALLTPEELRQFRRAESFLWSVRIMLHHITGRPEERLTFDVQRELAARLAYANRDSMSAVERFMRHYFLMAKSVGDLTGLFLAHLDESTARLAWLPTLTRRPARLKGFPRRRGQIGVPND